MLNQVKHNYLKYFILLYIAYLLKHVLFLLYLSLLLTIILQPIHKYLHKLTKNNILSAMITCCTFISVISFLLVIILPAFYNQISQLTIQLSNINWQNYFPMLVNTNFNWQANVLANLQSIIGYLSTQSFSILMFGGKFYLVVLMSFYMLKDFDKFVSYCIYLPYGNEIQQIAIKSLFSLKQLMRGQLLVSIMSSLFHFIVFSSYNYSSHALLFAIIAGFASFVPYIGSLTGCTFIILSVINDSSVLWWQIISISFTLILGNLLESGVLYPYFIAGKLKIHPLLFILYLLTFGMLFGLSGIILALPSSVIVHTVLTYLLKISNNTTESDYQ